MPRIDGQGLVELAQGIVGGQMPWGLLVMGLRYELERRRQLLEQHAALRVLESTLQAAPEGGR